MNNTVWINHFRNGFLFGFCLVGLGLSSFMVIYIIQDVRADRAQEQLELKEERDRSELQAKWEIRAALRDKYCETRQIFNGNFIGLIRVPKPGVPKRIAAKHCDKPESIEVN